MGANNAPSKHIPYYYNPKNGMFRECKINADDAHPPWGTLYDMPEQDQQALATLVLLAQEQNVGSYIGGSHTEFALGIVGKSSAFEEEGLLYLRVSRFV